MRLTECGILTVDMTILRAIGGSEYWYSVHLFERLLKHTDHQTEQIAREKTTSIELYVMLSAASDGGRWPTTTCLFCRVFSDNSGARQPSWAQSRLQ